MKFIILLACLFALAFANEDAKVLHNDAEVNPDSFKYSYELDNHVNVEQSGVSDGHEDWKVHGSYEYISPEGKNIKVTYTADDHGYHPVVQH